MTRQAEEKRKSAEEARNRVEKDTVENRRQGGRFTGVTGEDWNEATARVQACIRGWEVRSAYRSEALIEICKVQRWWRQQLAKKKAHQLAQQVELRTSVQAQSRREEVAKAFEGGCCCCCSCCTFGGANAS